MLALHECIDVVTQPTVITGSLVFQIAVLS